MSEHLRRIAASGGQARAAALRARRQAVALFPFDSEEHVMSNLEIICQRSVAGDLAGSQANAAVRACEVWVKTQSLKQSRDTIQELEGQIASLERQLKQARGRSA